MDFKIGDMVDASTAQVLVQLPDSAGLRDVAGLSDDDAETVWNGISADANNDDMVEHACDLASDYKGRVAEFAAIHRSMTGHWPKVTL